MNASTIEVDDDRSGAPSLRDLPHIATTRSAKCSRANASCVLHLSRVYPYPLQLAQRISRIDQQPVVLARAVVHVQRDHSQPSTNHRRVESASDDALARLLWQTEIDPAVGQAFVQPRDVLALHGRRRDTDCTGLNTIKMGR